MTKRVLITGAAGRIGRCLLGGMAERFDIRATDIVPLVDHSFCGEFILADLTDPTSAAALCSGVDIVIHLAGHPNSRDWDTLERSNTIPTRTLFDAAGTAGVQRIIYASSIHVVGYESSDTRLTDVMPYRPDCPYGLSKVTGEMLLRYMCDLYGLTGVALRICSFRPQPMSARELRTWLSPDDMVSLATAALTCELSGFRQVWGISNNTRAAIDRSGWRSIGYHPNDDAEVYAASLAAAGVDTALVSEWPFLGGPFISPPERP